jgi:hypothetical protein
MPVVALVAVLIPAVVPVVVKVFVKCWDYFFISPYPRKKSVIVMNLHMVKMYYFSKKGTCRRNDLLTIIDHRSRRISDPTHLEE